MIKNQEYIKILKYMVACVDHGDYEAVKELSNLELDNMKKRNDRTKRKIKQQYKQETKEKGNEIDSLNSKELIELLENYSKYIQSKIEDCKYSKDTEKDIINIEEFYNEI